MVFQYQYQYQYQLQRGLGLKTYESFSHILHDTYSNPVILSLIVAAVPLLFFLVRPWFVRTGVYKILHEVYRKRRRQKELNQARSEFEEMFLKKRRYDLPTLALIAVTVLLGGLIFSKTLFFVAVVSNSMAPSFWAGDLVLVQTFSKDHKAGDIAVFQNPQVRYDNKIIHRIVSISEEDIFTKGDNNNFQDEWSLSKDAILGSAVTLNGNPLVAKKLGRYFIKDFDPDKEADPAYQLLRRSMSNVHDYGPVYLLLIFTLIFLLQLKRPERGKVY